MRPSAIYSLRGAIATVEMIDPDGWFSATKDTPGQINIYWSAANSRYELQNLAGMTVQFNWFLMGASNW